MSRMGGGGLQLPLISALSTSRARGRGGGGGGLSQRDDAYIKYTFSME